MLTTRHFIIWDLRCLLRRFRHDFAKEATVALSAGILLALFFYVFGDFFTTKVNDLPPNFVVKLLWTVHCGLAVMQGLTLFFVAQAPDHQQNALELWSFRLGMNRDSLRLLLRWHQLQRFLFAALPWWLFTSLFIVPRLQPQWQAHLIFALAALVSVILGSNLKFRRPFSKRPVWLAADQILRRHPEPESALLLWKLLQSLWGDRLARSALILAAVHLVIALFFHVIAAPLSLRQAFCLLLSFWITVPLAIHLREDLRTAWLDKMFGIGHIQFQRSYQKNSLWLALPFALALALALLPLAQMPVDYFYQASSEIGILLSMPLLFPAVMFHVDGNRLFVTLAATLLLALFISTALAAHPAALALYFIVVPFFVDAQKGRYFRA